MRWSISAHRSFRRCPRQYYFNHMAAAWNATKMPWRREAHLLKQVKSLALWRGSLVSLMLQRLGCEMLANGAVDSEQPASWVSRPRRLRSRTRSTRSWTTTTMVPS